MQITPTELRIIGPTIRSVTKAHSQRFRKSEKNTPERSYMVLLAIEAEVCMALIEAGISLHKVDKEIDAKPIIRAQMLEDGYECPEDWYTDP